MCSVHMFALFTVNRLLIATCLVHIQSCRLKRSSVSQVVVPMASLLASLIRSAVAVVPVEEVDLAMSLLEKEEPLFVRAVEILIVSSCGTNH